MEYNMFSCSQIYSIAVKVQVLEKGHLKPKIGNIATRTWSNHSLCSIALCTRTTSVFRSKSRKSCQIITNSVKESARCKIRQSGSTFKAQNCIREYLSHPLEYQLQTVIFHLIQQFYSFKVHFGTKTMQIGQVLQMLLARSFSNVCFLN